MNPNVRKRKFVHISPAIFGSVCAFVQSDQNSLATFWISKDAKFLPADAQADLNLRSAHMSEGTFSAVSAQMISFQHISCFAELLLYNKCPTQMQRIVVKFHSERNLDSLQSPVTKYFSHNPV